MALSVPTRRHSRLPRGEPPFLIDIDLGKAPRTGSSLIFLGVNGELRCDLSSSSTGESAVVTFRANGEGLLATAETTVAANSFDDAEACGIRPRAASTKPNQFRAPNSGWRRRLRDQRGFIRHPTHFRPGARRDCALQGSTAGVSRENHRPLLSAFRDGLSSANPLYQVICFYRVIEGVRAVRSSRRQEATKRGIEISDPPERIPTEADLPDAARSEFRHSFEPHLGQKFGKVLDEYRDLLRNAIAHLNPESTHVVADRHKDVMDCHRALPVLRYIAREMLSTELDAIEGTTTEG